MPRLGCVTAATILFNTVKIINSIVFCNKYNLFRLLHKQTIPMVFQYKVLLLTIQPQYEQ